MQLMKGQNTALPDSSVGIRLNSPGAVAISVYAVLLGANDRVGANSDVLWPGAACPPGLSRDDNGLRIDLPAVAAEIQRIVVLAGVGGGRLPNLTVRVDDSDGTGLAEYSTPATVEETAIIMCEVYRRGGRWKLRAVGQGYRDGLAGAANDFGFDSAAVSIPAPVPVPGTTEPPPAPIPRTRSRTEHSEFDAAPGPRSRRADRARPAAPASAETPFLTRRTEVVRQVTRAGTDAVSSITALLGRVVAAASGSMPATRDGMQRIQYELAADKEVLWQAYETVRGEIIYKYRTTALTNRLAEDWHERQRESRAGYVTTEEIAAQTWLSNAAAAAEAVRGAGFRPTSSGRARQRQELMGQAEAVLRGYDGAVRSAQQSAESKTTTLFSDTFDEFRRRTTAAVGRIVGEYVGRELEALTSCPPEAQPVWQAIRAAEIVSSPPTRMLFPLGVIQLAQARMDTELGVVSPPGGQHRHRFTIPLAESTPPISVLLDLDETGGIVTDSAAVVENLTLDMLATLPAGRLKIDVVDPSKVGASMNFLYGIGEAGEQIYGRKVWGSNNVGELLTELENHVAFVTQKYLQGTHETLTAYNRSAGEVAEPYRLLLLFDHPHAFTRDGRMFDDESLRRVERLATVGRRAGVLIAATTDSNTTALGALATAFTRQQDTGLVARLQLPRALPGGNFVPGIELEWRLDSYPLPADAVRTDVLASIARSLATSTGTQVDPGRVRELAVQSNARAVARGLSAPETIADPGDPETWWGSSVDDRIVARFGRMGASDVAELRLDSGGLSSALIGGRTGSGKSVLLHSIILSIAMQYSPAEVEFYLVDFKEGVEFKQYATPGLPHAKVVAIETNRDFGISVLESLDAEIARRATLFKSAGQGEMEIGRYRSSTGARLPRIVLVIDEFHMLLEQDDATSTLGAALIDRIIRQGRAFGVHTILASQSVSGGGQKIRTALNQIPNRLVLASSTQDSEQLLAEGNADAQLLSKPGEGIINDHAGQVDANNRFQCAYWSTEQRAAVIARLRSKADAAGFTAGPAVFEGDIAVAPADYDNELFTRSSRNGTLVMPIGAPMSLAAPVAVRLERQPGNNMLLVDPHALTALVLQIAALRAADVRVEYIDFAAIEPAAEPMFARLRAHGTEAHHRRKLGDVLDSLVADITERAELDDYHSPARTLFLIGAHRARELTPDTFDPETESGRLAHVLRHGPEVGIHVIVWADRLASLQRRFDHDGLRQFGFKVLGPASEDDSRSLIDSEVAAKLTPNQFAIDDYDNARTDIVRRFAEPEAAWLDAIAGRGGGTGE
ncbi:cell division protein FtsK [Nocardia sp. SYP-A9097]|uniref:FtsK/SpoIIIE domain-containing protein n=1 Tax=Nocardia sp. SYP-A9097 TaxID=2663237 RepID=UPI00129BD441|nr:FtsK/SpoIIIE domain-containing protein [Nocardia sp. SYP-A9097]MRH91665.1 cell division protein FtsK [Nocardia sp. SYP-A9097]